MASTRLVRIFAVGVIGLTTFLVGDGDGASSAQGVRPQTHSPLRAGARPGCRWVQGAAKTTRICDTRGQCRTQTVPPQRIWACGTVRD